MAYLTAEEFEALGFDLTEDFDRLAQKASQMLDVYIGRFYDRVDFEEDVPVRKNAVKMAMSYQIDYLNRSGILTAEDKQSMTSVSIGRTSVSYTGTKLSWDNITLDAQAALAGLGFCYAGVAYDR